MKNSVDKARFYDLIIDRAKKELDACSSLNCDTANLIFKLIPELNIDEDGIILKEIISLIRYTKGREIGYKPRVHQEKMIAYLEKHGKQLSSAEDGKRPLRKLDYEGLTDFEKALANTCVGWMGKKSNWQHYIKDNADILLRIANNISNLIQDAPFEEKPANKFKPMYTIGDIIIPLNDEMCEVVGILMPFPDRAIYTLKRMSDICGKVFEADAHTIDNTATFVQRV